MIGGATLLVVVSSSIDPYSMFLEAHSRENEAFIQPNILAVGPENFDPSLQRSTPQPQLPLPEAPSQAIPTPNRVSQPLLKPQNLQINSRSDVDNFGQSNLIIEPTARFQFNNGDFLLVKTGFNTFAEQGIDTVTNIPLQIGWETKIGSVKVQPSVGIELFNRLPTALTANLTVEVPIARNLTLFGFADCGPYKANARTLENRIAACRFGPNLYWQIDKDTSLFALYRAGSYSDGNFEHQSFSRLERKFGQFSIAANLFTWIFSQDAFSSRGYFSPPDLLVYNGELAWEGNPLEFVRCRLSTTLGEQRLNNVWGGATTYQARCTTNISSNIAFDLGYSFSNVKGRNTQEDYSNQTITGQVRISF